MLSSSLNTIVEWCKTWQMTLNNKKSACMTVTRKKQPHNYACSIKESTLSRVSEHKYLGLTLTSDLRWDAHIANVTPAALRKLFFLRRCLRLAPQNTKLFAYTTLVRPILEYASTVWFPQSITNITRLDKVQRKAVRFIHNKYKPSVSPTDLAASSGLPSLLSGAKESRLKFLYQLLHNNYSIDVFKYVCFSQSRQSRHKHAHTLTEYSCRTNTLKHSFFPLAISEWNRLDPSITMSDSLSSFTSRLVECNKNQ